MKNIGFILGFILEIIAFFGFACLGILLPLSHMLQAIMFAVLLMGVLTFWSLCMAPKAPKKLKIHSYYLSKIVIYGLAALVIIKKESLTLGIIFIAVCFVDEILLYKHNLA